mmetsp:Transcript_4428/g.6738  ORF Transcript_4428/g.6738 Transcript_4428/m.6738 type:complete len:452 (-) Transcript_4428:372-1727(-)|eukprot:CAMPEP_0195301066 /NCGR_PEP_ID=MMETSP0707-20130614/28682_1 /TAXON_ID=33640 /ORGANISM="Asterionellopsis glacialis, Strain CCMP134" /LENGTH=451 /DNA_ID=CAMNT_0040363921 /DNA_START=49 /DNA_END=1404 /DNA_ORIENTATION=+
MSDGQFEKGEKQETRCRDPLFALLLYGNVGALIGVAAAYADEAFTDDTVSGYDYEGYLYAALICGGCALVFSALMMTLMMAIPQFLIKVSLVFMVGLTGFWMVIAFASNAIGIGIMGAIFFALMLCYAKAVWGRIPFATANLVTSGTAIKSNCGVTIFAYVFGALAFGWSALWTVAFLGVWEQTYDCEKVDGSEYSNCNTNYGYLFLLFLSFYFTHQVLQNCVHVTVSGVVGTWWFAPEESSSCCSSAVLDSFVRTVTTSFGSICFGSLLVAIVQALRAIANQAQANGDNEIIACIASCILSCLESLIEYFNKWAFVYVGLYGYSYLEAGKNVFTLFQNRGWEAIIADDLVGNTLFFLSVIAGALTGCLGLILEASSDLFDDAGGNSKAVSFTLGFIIGLVLCSILLSTIASGVNAVIVLFAESPAEFEQNYPELSSKMRETWEATFPGAI